MEYTKGKKVNIDVKGDKRQAVITQEGVDAKGKVRIRPDGFPMDISINKEEILSYV